MDLLFYQDQSKRISQKLNTGRQFLSIAMSKGYVNNILDVYQIYFMKDIGGIIKICIL